MPNIETLKNAGQPDGIQILDRKLTKNPELIPYYDSLNHLPENKLPDNKLAAALYYYAVNLGYKPSSALLTDLGNEIFKPGQEGKNGIYYQNEKWYLNDDWGSDDEIKKNTLEELIKLLNKKKQQEAMFAGDNESSRKKAETALKLFNLAAKGFDILNDYSYEKIELIKKTLELKRTRERKRIKALFRAQGERLKMKIGITNIPEKALEHKPLFNLWYLILKVIPNSEEKKLHTIIDQATSIVDAMTSLKETYFKKPKTISTSLGNVISRKTYNSPAGKLIWGKYIYWSTENNSWIAVNVKHFSGAIAGISTEYESHHKKPIAMGEEKIGLDENLFQFIQSKSNSARKNLLDAEKLYTNTVKRSLNSNILEESQKLAGKVSYSSTWQSISGNEFAKLNLYPEYKNQSWKLLKLSDENIVGYLYLPNENKYVYIRYTKKDSWKPLTKKEFESIIKNRKNIPPLNKGIDYNDESNETKKRKKRELKTILDLNNDNYEDVSGKTTKLDNKKKLELLFSLEIELDQARFDNIKDTPLAIKTLTEKLQKEYSIKLSEFPLIPLNSKVKELSTLLAKDLIRRYQEKIAQLRKAKETNFFSLEINKNGNIEVKRYGSKKSSTRLAAEKAQKKASNTLSEVGNTAAITSIETWNKLSPEFKKAGNKFKDIWKGVFEGGKGLWYEKAINIGKKSLIAAGRSLKYLTVGAAPGVVKGTFATGLAGLALLWRKVRRKRKAGEKTDMAKELSSTVNAGTKSLGKFAKFAQKFIKNKKALGFLAGLPIVGGLFASKAARSAINRYIPKQMESSPNKGEKINYPTYKIAGLRHKIPLKSRASLKNNYKIPAGYQVVIPKFTPSNRLASIYNRFRHKGRPAQFFIPHDQKISQLSAKAWMDMYYSGNDEVIITEGCTLPKDTILPRGTKLVKK